MQVRESNKKEIEARLEDMGDYVRMDYLASCLEENLGLDTKKFVLTKLAGIYEARKMFFDSGKMIRKAADINSTFEGRISDFLKASELFVKAGTFDEADITIGKALSVASESEKIKIRNARKEFYKTQAMVFLSKGKRKHAMDIYEKLMTFELSLEEKSKVKENLLELYRKLGKIREYTLLERSREKI